MGKRTSSLALGGIYVYLNHLYGTNHGPLALMYMSVAQATDHYITKDRSISLCDA